ncbi:MAG: putative sugar nucleotidyl transferase, partial [Marinifilum sp.]|nr:putative sugar nucleotidyl transferase [Marinifilum sp.]
MNYILFDDGAWNELLPLTFTRPVCEVRIGIISIREKWEHLLNTEFSFLTQEYLSEKYPVKKDDLNILINGSVIPNKELLDAVQNLKEGNLLIAKDIVLAACLKADEIELVQKEKI